MSRTGHHIINWKYFKIYVNGLFSAIEINIGRTGGFEWVIHIKTRFGFFISRINLPLSYLEKRINEERSKGGL